jgi:outer membrane protein assembly factor BamA
LALPWLAQSANAATAPAPDSSRSTGSVKSKAAADPALEDSAASEAAGPDSIGRRLYTYISYPFLQMVTLPVEVVLVPAVKMVLYPTKPPLRYMLNENVIDRTIKLISIGEEGRIMVYPTMNLAPGTGSSTGLSFRDQALFGRPTERAVLMTNLFVNGDWKMRTYATAADMAGSGLNSKLSVTLTHAKNQSFNMPGTPIFWSYADTSTALSLGVSHLLYERLALRGQYVFRDNHYGNSPTDNKPFIARAAFLKDANDSLHEDMRGLQSNWHDHIVAVGLTRDTRNNQNIVLGGSDFDASWQYHLTDAKHNYHAWELSLSNYFKLGKEKYEISTDEERKAGGLSMQKVLKKMELENLKKELFNRKVLATHLYAAQSFEVPGNHMPVYGLQTLGNDTPLRGYSGSRFRDYAVLSAGAEYRFPVMRLVDGVIFDEYGVFGRSWDEINYWDRLKNSWGFGIRVRRPDIYLFRCQLGFHGTQGIVLNLSVDEPY